MDRSSDVTAGSPALSSPSAPPWLPGLAAILALALFGIALRFLAYVLLTHQLDLPGYAAALCNWDCQWYADLAQNGYDLAPRDLGRANWAFFPLTPIAIAVVHALTGLPFQLSGSVVGLASIVASAVIARPLFEGRQRAFWLFRFAILAGPFSYAYSIGMSEPVFFLVSTAIFVCLPRGRYLAVGVLAALLTATRVTGILILIPIAVQIVQDLAVHAPASRPKNASCLARMGFALVATPLGLLAYMAYLQLHVGDALAFVHIQSGWGRELGNPLTNIFDGLRYARFGAWGLTMALVALLGLALSGVLLARRQAGMALFTAASIILSVSTGLISLPRFVAGLTPITFVASELLGGGRVRFVIAIALSAILCVVLSMLWMGGSPLVI